MLIKKVRKWEGEKLREKLKSRRKEERLWLSSTES